MIDLTLQTDLDLAVLMLKNRDDIDAAKSLLSPGTAKAELLAKMEADRQNIANEQKRRLKWANLAIPTLIMWSQIIVKESRHTENLNNKAA